MLENYDQINSLEKWFKIILLTLIVLSMFGVWKIIELIIQVLP